MRIVPALLLCFALCGCSSPKGVVFQEADGEYRWPPPPDQPRIAYVGQLVTDRDLKAKRSFAENLGEFLFGREPAQGMVSPLAVCTDGAQRVFVADPGARVVHVFDLDSRKYRTWTPPEDIARFSQPVALAFDPRGRLLVSDSAEGSIFVFGSEGEYLGTFGDNWLDRPVGIVADPSNEHFFVADAGAHQVVVLAFDGEEITRIGRRGVGPGEFNFPTNVALDADGRLYVSDSLNFRVQVFGPDFQPLRSIGRKGDMPGYFAQPKGVAVDPQGHVYVVDAHFEAVQIFNSEGRLLMTFGQEGRGPGEFWLPAGIYIDQKGWIWVADSYNLRVQVFEFLGAEVGP